MGTDMHVAIEVRRNDYDYKSKSIQPKWFFVKKWSVDRCYSLFGCFGNYRCDWSNALDLPCATNLSYELKLEAEDGYYGFHIVTPDRLKKEVLNWSPSKSEWEEYEGENCEPPVIDKEWFFDTSVYLGNDEYIDDPINYWIYKLALKKYGKDNVRLIVYFDS